MLVIVARVWGESRPGSGTRSSPVHPRVDWISVSITLGGRVPGEVDSSRLGTCDGRALRPVGAAWVHTYPSRCAGQARRLTVCPRATGRTTPGTRRRATSCTKLPSGSRNRP